MIGLCTRKDAVLASTMPVNQLLNFTYSDKALFMRLHRSAKFSAHACINDFTYFNISMATVIGFLSFMRDAGYLYRVPPIA